MLSVSIGLLWNEPVIQGTLNGSYSAQCFTDCNRWLDLEEVTGRLRAADKEPERQVQQWAIRLGECFSKEKAELLLAKVENPDLIIRGEVVEAGKKWPTRLGMLDNRVWWPVIKLDGRDQAEIVFEELRRTFPIGMAVMRLSKPDMKPMFWLRLGNLGGNVVRVKLVPNSPDATITLKDVPIGRGFHWERREALTYRGEMEIFATPDGGLTAANHLPLEHYVETAVGSEMREDLPPVFSQVQAIAARSTALATANRHHFGDGFDLCNDDHCQCYQGTVREADAVIEPIRATSGRILVFGQRDAEDRPIGTWRVVDARYAKACGGVSDRYSDIWGPDEPGYFEVQPCGQFHAPDLEDDRVAERFLYDSPKAYCNPGHYPYPQPWDEDKLFRWVREYDPIQLSGIVERKTGAHIGVVKDLMPRQRSQSGRIMILDILGSEGTTTLYGELEIRRALSDSHLPSSCFVLKRARGMLILRGGGWGHGVGMCQLGAVAMAKEGWTIERILAHYYPNTALETV
ncbi:MAG: SpoIID/LytB domain-containing protein [Calditrichaeota bacterium]|nr:SpoIID/LytB domain-containing protein [Calditrichota bacterium]